MNNRVWASRTAGNVPVCRKNSMASALAHVRLRSCDAFRRMNDLQTEERLTRRWRIECRRADRDCPADGCPARASGSPTLRTSLVAPPEIGRGAVGFVQPVVLQEPQVPGGWTAARSVEDAAVEERGRARIRPLRAGAPAPPPRDSDGELRRRRRAIVRIRFIRKSFRRGRASVSNRIPAHQELQYRSGGPTTRRSWNDQFPFAAPRHSDGGADAAECRVVLAGCRIDSAGRIHCTAIRN